MSTVNCVCCNWLLMCGPGSRVLLWGWNVVDVTNESTEAFRSHGDTAFHKLTADIQLLCDASNVLTSSQSIVERNIRHISSMSAQERTGVT